MIEASAPRSRANLLFGECSLMTGRGYAVPLREMGVHPPDAACMVFSTAAMMHTDVRSLGALPALLRMTFPLKFNS